MSFSKIILYTEIDLKFLILISMIFGIEISLNSKKLKSLYFF